MSASKEPPRLPTVVDEAGETPGWIPMLGIAVLVVVGLYIAMGQAHTPAEGATAEPAEAAAAEGEAKPAEAEAKPAEAEAKPAAPKAP